MRPSAITHSILVRLYQRAGYEDDAAEAVAQLYQHHGIERPMGGERSKTLGKRAWGLKSPPNQCKSPCASPAGPHGFGMPRDRAESCWSAGSWDGAPHLPMLPSYGESDQSGCNTPMGHSGAVFLPCPVQPPMPGHGPAPFVATSHGADQLAFPVPGQYMGSSPTNSCDMMAFTASGQGAAFPQWQFGCTMPASFPCSPVTSHAGGPEVQAAYPCQGMVQPFAVMPMPVAPPYGVACAPVPQQTPGYDGWDAPAGHMPHVSMPCCS